MRFLVVSMLLVMAAATTAGAEQSTIVFGTRGGAFNADGVSTRQLLAEMLIEEFEAENPDINVEWQQIDGDYDVKIVALAAAGDLPDVFEAWGSMGISWADRGMLMDLGPWVERDFSQEEIDDIIPTVWNAPVVRVGPNAGMRFGVPRYLNVVIFYYNQTMFDEFGLVHLDKLAEQGNWTWDTLVEYGQTLTTRNADGTYRTYGLRTDDGIGRSAAWIWAAGGQVFNFPDDPTEFMMDQEPALRGLEFLYDLRWTYEIWPVETPGFQDGGVTGMDNTPATDAIRSLETEIGNQFAWDVAPRPMGPAGRGTRTSLDLYVMARTTEEPEAAWRFVKYLTSRSAQLKHAVAQGMIPIRKSLYQDYLELFPNRAAEFFYSGALDARPDPTSLMVHATEAAELIDQAIESSIVLNEKDVRTAVREIAPAIRALYE